MDLIENLVDFFHKKLTYLANMQRIFFARPKNMNTGGFSKNPFFPFGFLSFVLLGLLFFSSSSLADLGKPDSANTVSFSPFSKASAMGFDADDSFFKQTSTSGIETPDLKITGDGFVAAISTPSVYTTHTLGVIMGGSDEIEEREERKEVTEYVVQEGDTIESIAEHFNISIDTVLWANDISKNTALKSGQTLTILPVSGLVHVIKSGDTISEISKTYKADTSGILAFNTLSSENDIFIGDTLIIPEGVMPIKSSLPATQTLFADSFFGNPTQGKITQGLHYYNAVDVANKCGTPIYAAASGTIQRAVANGAWNSGKGNYATILHANGTATYYGHFMSLSVGVGSQVNAGDVIGLMGRTGDVTGCNLHFQAIGSKNPLAKYKVGTVLK